MRNSSSIDDSTWEGLADALLLADVGVVTTDALVDGLRKRVGREGVADADGLLRLLKVELWPDWARRIAIWLSGASRRFGCLLA